MALEYEYSKVKLSKTNGYSHLLKKTELDEAIDAAGLTELGSVFLGESQISAKRIILLHADLYGEARAGYWMKQKPHLSVYAVPSNLRNQIRELLDKQNILQMVMKWLAELESASGVRRDVDQNLWVVYSEGKITITNQR